MFVREHPLPHRGREEGEAMRYDERSGLLFSMGVGNSYKKSGGGGGGGDLYLCTLCTCDSRVRWGSEGKGGIYISAPVTAFIETRERKLLQIIYQLESYVRIYTPKKILKVKIFRGEWSNNAKLPNHENIAP